MSIEHITGTAASVISPYVTQYSPAAFINVDASLNELVTVQGIDRVFTKNLIEGDAVKLLNGFDCSGMKVDCRLSQKDYDLGGLNVVLETEGAYATDFRAVIEDAINTATDGSGALIDAWLASQLRTAFINAFGSALPASSIAGVGDVSGYNGVVAAQDASTNEVATDAKDAVAAVSIALLTQINGFSVDVLTDASEAAANLISGHNSNAGALASIFRQCRTSRFAQYLPEGADGAEEVLTTRALPLLKNDSIEFIFDIDTEPAASQAVPAGGAAAPAEDVPISGTQSTAYGTSSFSLNMANRRVALKFQFPGSTAIPFTGLRPGETEGTGGNPASGAGTNPA